MSITQFTEERQNGSDQVSGQWTGRDTTFSKRYVALADSRDDGPYAVYNHPSCPKIGDAYTYGSEYYTTSRVVDVKVDPGGGGFASSTGSAGLWKWLVAVEYSRHGLASENPLLRPAVISIGANQYDAPLEKDLDGKPVLNSAKQPFDPPAIREDVRMIVTIEKFLSSVSYSFIDLVSNTVNSTTFLGFPAHSLRITSITAQPQTDDLFGTYYNVVAEMQFRRVEYTGHQPHQANLLDMGRYELFQNPVTGVWKHRPILGTDGELVVDPVMLDGNGLQVLNPSDPNSAVFIFYKRYRTYDFNLLGLIP